MHVISVSGLQEARKDSVIQIIGVIQVCGVRHKESEQDGFDVWYGTV